MKTNPLRVAAEAARTSEKTISRWRDNGALPLRANDVTTSGTGNQCGYSRPRILQAAITQALVEKHVALSTASNAALKFTDEGQTGRPAAQLFPLGKTILRLGSKDAEVANVDFGASIFDLSNDGVTICIDLNRIVEQVDSVLNKSKRKT
jgi:hypothetical protein